MAILQSTIWIKEMFKKECCKQFRYVKFFRAMARTTSNTQNDTKTRRTPWRNRHPEKAVFLLFFFCFFFFFFLLFLNWILQEMLSCRLGTVNGFHWELKPVLSYSKPHTFSTYFGEEKEKYAFTLSNQAI